MSPAERSRFLGHLGAAQENLLNAADLLEDAMMVLDRHKRPCQLKAALGPGCWVRLQALDAGVLKSLERAQALRLSLKTGAPL